MQLKFYKKQPKVGSSQPVELDKIICEKEENMNNQFSENLKKIRKEQNLSQEELADELGVSRQAISKWESSQAYPEMDKIIMLCDKFNLNIDDLLHRDIKEVKGEEESKKKLNNSIYGFLKNITNTINMFSRMTFKSKVKCIFEQILIGLILLALSAIIVGALGILVSNLTSFLPFKVESFIERLFEGISIVACLIASLVIMGHVFKARYLNYYEEVKDKENSKEDNCSSDDNKIILDKKENKIIIRDPKHSDYRFLRGLYKILIIMIKFFLAWFALFVIFGIIFLLIGLVLSFLTVKTGLFFVGLLFAIVSLSLIGLIILLALINFIFNRKSNKKMMIYGFILSVVVFGIGAGLTFLGSLSFDVIEMDDSLLKTQSFEHNMTIDTVIDTHYYDVEYIETNTNNIKVEYAVNKYCDVYEYTEDDNSISAYVDCKNPMRMVRAVVKNLGDKKITNMSTNIESVKIYANKANIEILENNAIKRDQEIEERNNTLNNYENEINRLEDENEQLREQIDNLRSE